MVAVEEALKIALDSVGYDNLDGEAVQAALNSGKLTNIDTKCGAPINIMQGDRRFFRNARLVTIRDGTVVPLTDFVSTPDLAPTAAWTKGMK